MVFRLWKSSLMISLVTRNIMGPYFIVAIMIITHIARRADSCNSARLWDGSLEVTVPSCRILVMLDISKVQANIMEEGAKMDGLGLGQG
jgi:hypothetical protein